MVILLKKVLGEGYSSDEKDEGDNLAHLWSLQEIGSTR